MTAEHGAGHTVGPYRVTGLLGKGGMGAVYRALDPGGREVALKQVLPGAGLEELERFRREALASARVRHPGVVGVHALERDERGQHYLVMDLIPGESLQARLKRGGPLPEPEAVRLGIELAEALGAAHAAGVLHRDLKPHNVLVTPEGRAVLTDFGLARLVDASQALTRTGTLLGTPGYMAPEQADGGGVDARADVYGIGATLYAALAGQPPFVGGPAQVLGALLTRDPEPLRRLRPQLSAGLEAVVMACLARDPARRPASALALAEALRRCQAGGRPVGPAALAAAAALALPALAWLVLQAGAVPSAPPSSSPQPPTLPHAPPRPQPEPDRELEPPLRPAELFVELKALLEREDSTAALALCDRLEELQVRRSDVLPWRAEALLLEERYEQAAALLEPLGRAVAEQRVTIVLASACGRLEQVDLAARLAGVQPLLLSPDGSARNRALAGYLELHRLDPDDAARAFSAGLAPARHRTERVLAARGLVALRRTRHDRELEAWAARGRPDGRPPRCYRLPHEVGPLPAERALTDDEVEAARSYLIEFRLHLTRLLGSEALVEVARALAELREPPR